VSMASGLDGMIGVGPETGNKIVSYHLFERFWKERNVNH
jgi:hypothetical protein